MADYKLINAILISTGIIIGIAGSMIILAVLYIAPLLSRVDGC
jgi:hypothetical protein